MRPEILAEIKRRNELWKARIASGEILVCSRDRPMPKDQNQMGQKWFHEEAKCASILPDGKDGTKQRIYHCPVCGIDFPVTLRKIIPNAG